jgi:hypothetical protein
MPARPIAVLLLVLAANLAAAEPRPVRYTMRYDAATETMAVRICVPESAPARRFVADRNAVRYVDALAREGAPAPAREGGGWIATDWRGGECLAYRAALGRIVDSGDRGNGARHGGAIVVDPDLWLLRLDDADQAPPAEAEVDMPQGYAISAPWRPLPATSGARRFAIAPTPKDWLARVAIGQFTPKDIALPGGTLRLAILDDADAEQRSRLEAWLAHVSRATLSAYGKLPLDDVQVLIVPEHGQREPVGFGQSSRGQGNALTLFVDPAQSSAAFDRDWVAVHELSHLFHPYLDDEGSWLAEGLATYYQNVLRARAGLLTPADAWEQIDAGFARGRGATRPGGDIPLDASGERPNYLRIYWSGTAFWLEADTALRRASGDKIGIDEALRRFDACCLPSYRTWEPADFVAKLDALVGSDVFRTCFAAYAARRDFPDLKTLYRALGIVRGERNALTFDDTAPDASVRRAIMTPPERP